MSLKFGSPLNETHCLRMSLESELHYIISIELVTLLQSLVLHLSVSCNEVQLHYMIVFELL